MGFFNRRKRTETRAGTSGNAGSLSLMEFSDLLKGSVSSDGITPDRAMGIPAFSACVNFVSDAAASLPVKLFKKQTDGSIEEIKDDYRLYLLNNETGDLLNAFQFKRAMVMDYLLHGNAYAYIDKQLNKINGLYYVDADNITVDTNTATNPIRKVADIRVLGKKYYDNEFIITARQSKDGVTGVGVVGSNKDLLSIAYNTMIFENQLVKNGGNKRGFLQVGHKVEQPILDDIKAGWKSLYSGNDDIVILNDGITFQEASETSSELQLNERKSSNSNSIYEMMGIPINIFAGGASTSDYQNAINTAVMPPLQALQASFNKSLLLESEKQTMFFEFDFNELNKGDLIQRAQAYQIGLKAGYLTVDEVREKENMSPIDLDFVRLGLNDVLYNSKDRTIYTPNTGQWTNLKGGAKTNED